jgi:hypothetical protein
MMMPEISVWHDFGLGVVTGLGYSVAAAGAAFLCAILWVQMQRLLQGTRRWLQRATNPAAEVLELAHGVAAILRLGQLHLARQVSQSSKAIGCRIAAKSVAQAQDLAIFAGPYGLFQGSQRRR